MDFRIYKPQGKLADHIQAIWSVAVPENQAAAEQKLLFSDAGTGIVFNLGCEIVWGERPQPMGVVLESVSPKAQAVLLPPGAVLAGIRFHPAMGFSFLGKRYDRTVQAEDDPEHARALQALQLKLVNSTGHQGRISLIYRWLIQSMDVQQASHDAISGIMKAVHSHDESRTLPVSPRQIERHFQKWLGITPKHYQRILRVRNTIDVIRTTPDINLAELAVAQGFSDQAHMTREFSAIACITPGNSASG
ncbi:AraC family transcriptional regulator (plasmid) [Photobacterium sp. GJ3]|uniref:helix-turn-helix domain-containing protein n=1 Tax=Photobacterium sp. GJ3 TaxID=2829502 RepID=UPI001B8C922C|nr:helix-turn-helix domain-containing protein [Photobacterium sp. GJ3]QUJ70162.1 AraC family transcriptional regulator [Photobacterium sp. GJ3]